MRANKFLREEFGLVCLLRSGFGVGLQLGIQDVMKLTRDNVPGITMQARAILKMKKNIRLSRANLQNRQDNFGELFAIAR